MMKHIPAPLTLALTVTFVLSPALTDPFTGFRADQLPVPQINPPIQPAGYTFAIWGLIYGWLVVSAVFGIARRATDPAWDRVRWPLAISLAVGTPWLAVANESAIWATVLIFVMAISAIFALLRAPDHDRWWFAIPISIYAGWLTAASFVALGSTAAGYGLLLGAEGWAYVGIIAALLVAIPVLRISGALSYGITMIWALVGIIIANGTANMAISILVAAGIVAILLAARRPTGQTVPS